MRKIFLGFACNNACVFCAQGSLRDKEEGPPDVAAKLATIVAGETVAFTGGEPTIHDELPAWKTVSPTGYGRSHEPSSVSWLVRIWARSAVLQINIAQKQSKRVFIAFANFNSERPRWPRIKQRRAAACPSLGWLGRTC